MADVSIAEAMIAAMGAQVTAYDKLGVRAPAGRKRLGQQRAPQRLPVRRRAVGGRVSPPSRWPSGWSAWWAGPSWPTSRGSPPVVAGCHAVRCWTTLGQWIGGFRRDEVIVAFEEAGAAVAPIYEVDDVLQDPHFRARQATVTVPDGELDSVCMPNVAFRLSETTGADPLAGPATGRAHRRRLERRPPMSTVEDQRWNVLDPSTDPTDPDAYPRTRGPLALRCGDRVPVLAAARWAAGLRSR